jgi:hypothetical protein
LPGGQLRKHVFGDSENFVKMSCFSDSNFYKTWRRGGIRGLALSDFLYSQSSARIY